MTNFKPTVTVFAPKEWITLWNVQESRYHAALTVGGEEEERIHRTTLADLQAMFREFQEDDKVLTVYREHFNRNPDKETDALGYVVEMRLAGNELQGRFHWTPLGLDSVSHGLLRYLSPEMAVREAGTEQGLAVIRPFQMLSVGLTNMPANRTLPPISVAQGSAAPIFAHREPGAAGGLTYPATNSNSKNTMLEKIIAMLALAPTATEEDVLATIEGLQKTCETASKEAEEAFISTNRAAITAAAEPHWRALFRSNPDAARAMLPAAPAPAATVFRSPTLAAPVTPRSPGITNPGEVPEGERTPVQHAAVFQALPQGKQRTAYFQRFKTEIRAASVG